FFFQAEDGIRDPLVTGVQTCALPIFARQSETSILRYHQGIAVEILHSRFLLPHMRETSWYEAGLIHLQSLPAMVTCQVLDPKPRSEERRVGKECELGWSRSE